MSEFQIEIGDDDTPFLRLGDYTLRLDLEELDEEYKNRAIKDLRETPENVEEALKTMRQMIKDEPGLNLPIEDEQFLIKFLRPCKFYPQSAFKLMRKFYSFKAAHPKYGANLYPTPLRHVFDKEVFVFLPTRGPGGSRIMIANVGTKWNPKEVSLDDLFRAVMLSIEIAMIEPKTQVGGVHVIMNMKGLSLSHVYMFSPSLAKMMVDWVQECAPVRLKGIHVINQPFIFSLLWAIFKPFVGAKLRQRLFFHGSNKKALVEHISSKTLPPCFGGVADIPDFPGSLFADMLVYAEKKFEPCNIYGYVKEKAGTIDAED
ncbi:hypothetical protein HHI36_003874 [Cryptolaemus montrouzieri]|uniref:CRAL-TRIO domain-containing protein n=1 Tax=Cryptolaemus montrouzieri TaxID=559131 RepID=A0ABD2NPH7_9CUCU